MKIVLKRRSFNFRLIIILLEVCLSQIGFRNFRKNETIFESKGNRYKLAFWQKFCAFLVDEVIILQCQFLPKNMSSEVFIFIYYCYLFQVYCAHIILGNCFFNSKCYTFRLPNQWKFFHQKSWAEVHWPCFCQSQSKEL